MLRRAFTRRRSLGTRRRCIVLCRLRWTVHLRTIGLWPIWFGTIIRFRCRWTLRPRRWFCRPISRCGFIRLRTGRFGTIIRLCRRRTIRPRWWLCRPISRCRFIRLRCRRTTGWYRLVVCSGTVGLRRICTWMFVRRGSWSVSWLAARFGHGRSRGLSGRGLLHRRTPSGRGAIRGLQMLHLLPRDRLSWMCRQRLLPSCERHRRRRHFSLGYDWTAYHSGRRRFDVIRRVGMRSQHAVDVGATAALELTGTDAISLALTATAARATGCPLVKARCGTAVTAPETPLFTYVTLLMTVVLLTMVVL